MLQVDLLLTKLWHFIFKPSELQHQSRVANIQHKYEEEVCSTQQDFEELCRVTKERMCAEIQDKIKRIQEDAIITRLGSGELFPSFHELVDHFVSSQKVPIVNDDQKLSSFSYQINERNLWLQMISLYFLCCIVHSQYIYT